MLARCVSLGAFFSGSGRFDHPAREKLPPGVCADTTTRHEQVCCGARSRSLLPGSVVAYLHTRPVAVSLERGGQTATTPKRMP